MDIRALDYWRQVSWVSGNGATSVAASLYTAGSNVVPMGLGGRAVLLFIDDFSTPRVSSSMQRVLNRLFLQRSPNFLSKLATANHGQRLCPRTLVERPSRTVTTINSSTSARRRSFFRIASAWAFLTEVFARRLAVDARVPATARTLGGLLGHVKLSKTEFASTTAGIFGRPGAGGTAASNLSFSASRPLAGAGSLLRNRRFRWALVRRYSRDDSTR